MIRFDHSLRVFFRRKCPNQVLGSLDWVESTAFLHSIGRLSVRASLTAILEMILSELCSSVSHCLG